MSPSSFVSSILETTRNLTLKKGTDVHHWPAGSTSFMSMRKKKNGKKAKSNRWKRKQLSMTSPVSSLRPSDRYARCIESFFGDLVSQ